MPYLFWLILEVVSLLLVCRGVTLSEASYSPFYERNGIFGKNILVALIRFQGVHPRIITEGFELAKEKALTVLDQIKCDFKINRDRLVDIARTSLATKVHQKLADKLTDVVVDAILAVKREEEPINLHMVEIMEMQHKLDCDTR